MARFSSEEEYLQVLNNRSQLPEGFSAATTSLDFTSKEKQQRLSMNLALILLDEPSSRFAGIFTRNRFCGAPILIGRRRIEQENLRGVLINNRIANVGAPGGVEDARLLCDALGELIGEPGNRFLPASTGIIGWKLPVESMKGALPNLIAGLHRESVEVGEGCILGVVKGAGMIEPDMGTMLAFILTDLKMEREQLRQALQSSVDRSINRISVDGDQSTSDIALLFSSARKPGVSEDRFRKALDKICLRLAEDVVRNGEGVAHVIRVCVEGAPSQSLAAAAGKAVVNSPLVKTAVFGNDPNVGRIVSALGDFASAARFPIDLMHLRVSMDGVEIFVDGCFFLDADKEERLNRYLTGCAMDPTAKGFPAHDREVVLEIDLGAGEERVEVLGADLSYQYVKENADYRS
jgi:glutamate N-acetyltransferase/amino-acid N-acetyltransferase